MILNRHIDLLNYMSYIAPHTGGGWYPSWDAYVVLIFSLLIVINILISVWHISPLTGDAPNHPYSIEKIIEDTLAAGIPASKIGIGMAFFASCWTYPITQPTGQVIYNFAHFYIY